MVNFIRQVALKYGIDMLGICEFSNIEPYLITCKAQSFLQDNPKSIIAMLFPYYIDLGEHNISRYAIIKDYHVVCRKILENISLQLKSHYPNFSFVPFIDNSPIPEVRCGVLCGLGCLGDNNLLINKKYGSWTFIGEIVTDMGMRTTSHYSECLHCGKCIIKCPGKSLSPHSFKKSTCISYISQKKGILSENEVTIFKKGKLIWGCDICQECCPLNKLTAYSNIQGFKSDIHPIIRPGEHLNLSCRAFHWRPHYVIERNINLMNL